MQDQGIVNMRCTCRFEISNRGKGYVGDKTLLGSPKLEHNERVRSLGG